MYIAIVRAVCIVFAALALAGCGGGGGSSKSLSTPIATSSPASSAMSSAPASSSSSLSSSNLSSSVASTPLQWIKDNTVTLNSTDPANEDYSDLTAFGDAIGDARIVGLAEQSHGGKEEFELKTRLVKYLHKNKGFDVLILESGFYDVGRIWEKMQAGAKVDDEAVGNIFFMYSKSSEGRKLLQYIDSTQADTHPLLLAGMDSQHTGAYSQNEMMNKLESFLLGRGSNTVQLNDWLTFKTVSTNMFKKFDVPYTTPSSTDQSAFRNITALLQTELCATQTDNFQTTASPGWWCQVVKSIDAVATLYWSADDQRDYTIGTNVVWLADNPYAGKKIIVWGHAVHTLYNYPFDTTHNNAGTVIRNHFNQNYYVANVTAYEGSILSYNELLAFPIPIADTDSLESLFNEAGKPLAYLNNPATRTGVEWLDVTSARLTNFFYNPNISVNGLGHNFDTFFYFKTVSPVTMLR